MMIMNTVHIAQTNRWSQILC